jgi:hypothetical protein
MLDQAARRSQDLDRVTMRHDELRIGIDFAQVIRMIRGYGLPLAALNSSHYLGELPASTWVSAGPAARDGLSKK